MVNYSKWDNLDVSDDEGERKVHVQRFDKPQSVIIGGRDGVGSAASTTCAVEDDEDTGSAQRRDDDEPMEPGSDVEELAEAGEDCREDVLQCRALADRALARGDAAEGVRLLEKAMRLGGARCPGVAEVLESARRQLAAQADARRGSSSASPDGAVVAAGASASMVDSSAGQPDPDYISGGIVDDRYSWSQTRDAVEVNVFVPEDTKAKNVQVVVTETTMKISANGKSLLEGQCEFKVAPEEDPDWELHSWEGRRAIKLTVRKAVMPGGLSVVVWWKRVLKGEQAIDDNTIAARKRDKSDQFAKAWADAHVNFRESVQKREKIIIYPEEESGGEETIDRDGDATM